MLDLLPPGLSPAFAGLLIAVSFLTSAMTAAFGIGGGVALLTVMASGMPVAALIPVHGAVQLGSNTGRAVLLAAHVSWRFVALLAAGTALGVAIGGYFVVTLPDAVLKVAIAVFVLWTVWGSRPRLNMAAPAVIGIGGAVAAVLTMFIGASGPFVAALIATQDFARQTLVATHAAAMIMQHLLKIVVFGILGFAFAPWLLLIAAMIATGFLGTYTGVRLLHGLPEDRFRLGFKIILTLLALNLIRGAIASYL